jgi:hypothetical protein
VKRPPAVVAVLAVTSLAAMGLGAAPARAGGGCVTPTCAHFFDGATATRGGSVVGAVAYLSDEQPSLCAPADGTTGSSDWVMVGDTSSTLMYAQAGYIQLPGRSLPTIFTEYDDGTRTDGATSTDAHWKRTLFVPDPALHSTAKFAVGLSYDGKAMNMLVNDQLVTTTPFDPHATWGPQWMGEFLGEGWDAGDDVPGTSAARARFTQMNLWDTVGGYGRPIVERAQTTGTWYYNSTTAAGIDIWTDRTGTLPPNPITHN